MKRRVVYDQREAVSDDIKRRLGGEPWYNFCGGDHAPIVCPTHDRLPTLAEMGELVGHFATECIAGDPLSVKQSEDTLRTAMERLHARASVNVPAGLSLPSQSELDAWRKRAEEAEAEVEGVLRVIRSRLETMQRSPSINATDSRELDLIRLILSDVEGVRASVMQPRRHRNDSGADRA